MASMMIARLAGMDGNADPYPKVILPESLDELDSATMFHIMGIYGYFFISLVQLVGIFGGDRSPLQVSRVQKATKKAPSIFMSF